MWSSDEEEDCVVLDNGSHRIKAGFAGHDTPRIDFRTVIGTPLYQGQTIGGKPQKKYFVGDQVIENIDVLDIRRPIERGIVTDWDAMERVWHHVFDELRTVPSDMSVLVTETPMNPKSQREKIAQIMFEKIQPRGMYVVSPNVLSLYSSGRGSGLVIDSGYEVTDVVCIFEGHKVRQSMFRADIGGNDITHYLIELLGKRGYAFTTAKEVEEVSVMKEKYAYVSNNPQTENVDNIRQEYTFSNGTTICLDYERFQCMEAMFKPHLIGSDACGIHELIVKSIKACPVDVRNDIYCSFILSGGNTMTEGLVSRLEQELRALLPLNRRIKVIAPPERRISTWVGGSIWGSLSSSQQLWMTPVEYDEFGPSIVYRSKFTQHW
ncbi:actin, cytoplasmic 2-like isoform X1 [Mizuhopecten yessoensis]|uniref:actin, cytoplasmic 2-like isoform X1 n=1 Tax=Mizuhopecten yessoensis TaxID=6573 RepID=UPI000B459CD6|nr:actin, cytoplasmic 2-like isoform X1 [Mizuhopecten yessoensis]XP_021373915.1 actin, cytoplasmic 2-like isoform X1 [Mizuhopecten yessoensis]XP_021373925.1 actin, cytoplasmic 2-like isoform X1 [Mizuhopecten yessoensis]XP_021373935.1 actin, cytoplasmic 2-like isoform X1 [Mizuhopecten yessoensis]